MLGLVSRLSGSGCGSKSTRRRASGGSLSGGGSGVATLLLRDGTARDYSRRMRCGEVLAEFPGSHGVCPAAAVVLKQAGKVLSKDAYLELGTIYFLLAKDHGQAAQCQQVKFVITKEYISRIMGDASSGHAPQLKRSDTPLICRPREALSTAKRSRGRSSRRGPWVSTLSSIPEAALVV